MSKSRIYKPRYALGLVLAIFFGLLQWGPLPLEKLQAPQAYRFFGKHNDLIHAIISSDNFYRMRVAKEEIPTVLRKALLLKEDKSFYQHPGVDPLALVRALKQNLTAKHVVSGASTITMQLARMLDRRPRTYTSKLIEVWRALQLEMRMSKSEILAAYLSLAPYGGNIEGVEAAAHFYFGKPVRSLSFAEVALLISIPNDPNSLRPDRSPVAARNARDKVLQLMLQSQLINEDQHKRAVAENVNIKRHRPPELIPHLAWRLRITNPKQYDWHTTIDSNIQRRTTTLVRNHLNSLNEFRIYNSSAVVIDNSSREILAYVGSGDYNDDLHSGKVDGVWATRSPGSTFKPFLYSLAFERGLISEKTVLFDVPQNYGGYSPQNFSKNFFGLIPASEALSESLNVVAVRLSQEMGLDVLYNFLKTGGISTLTQSKTYYGLPLALGGAEVRLIELANLYSTIANSGDHQNYRIDKNEVRSQKVSLFSPETAWMVTQILTNVERPDFPQSWKFSKSRPTLAWKTGTSYGHQDAWSLGYNPKYTVGVWVGNFDGSPSAGLVGSRTAGPLLFDIFQSITSESSDQWFKKPSGIGEREVCEICGTLPGPYCQARAKENYIKHIRGPALEKTCEIPQLIRINKKTLLQATSGTPVDETEGRIYNIWPAEVATFLLKHGVPVREAPPYDLGNMAGQKYYPPKILNPSPNATYYRRLDRFDEKSHGLRLAAAVTNRIRKVSWFLDGKLIFQGDPINDQIINPPPGDYKLTLLDETGGKDEIRLVVKDFRDMQ